jgi:hypothetical protein
MYKIVVDGAHLLVNELSNMGVPINRDYERHFYFYIGVQETSNLIWNVLKRKRTGIFLISKC